MEWFASSLKRKLNDPDLDKIEAVLEGLAAQKEKYTDTRALSPVSKMPFKIHDLLQIGLRRILELSDASVRELNRQNVSSSMVLVRAVFETSCLLFDAANRVVAASAKDDVKELDELDKFLMDVLMGFKSKEWGFSEEFAARNVLTIIQRIGKQLGIDLMWYYEGLSEHAHPNYLGMMSVYRLTSEDGNPIVRYADSPNEARDTSIGIAIGGFAMAVEMMNMALVRYAEVAGRFTTLAERQIHEAGTWPREVEYPVKR
jgi:hypothetical protein